MARESRLRCPKCGWVMQKGDLHSGGFLCPGCGERLRVRRPRARAIGFGSIALGVSFCYFAGYQSIEMIFFGLCLSFPIFFLSLTVDYLLWPPLEVDKPEYGDVDFYITGPRDRRRKF